MNKYISFLILFFFFLVIVIAAIFLIIAINKSPGPAGPTGFATMGFPDNETGPTLEDGRSLFFVGSFLIESGETLTDDISLEN